MLAHDSFRYRHVSFSRVVPAAIDRDRQDLPGDAAGRFFVPIRPPSPRSLVIRLSESSLLWQDERTGSSPSEVCRRRPGIGRQLSAEIAGPRLWSCRGPPDSARRWCTYLARRHRGCLSVISFKQEGGRRCWFAHLGRKRWLVRLPRSAATHQDVLYSSCRRRHWRWGGRRRHGYDCTRSGSTRLDVKLSTEHQGAARV